MTKSLIQAIGVFFLGGLLAQEASAGSSAFAQFNTFSFTAAGPIQDGGMPMQAANLTTNFNLGLGGQDQTLGAFTLDVTFSGPGAPDNFVPNLNTICSGANGQYNCNLSMQPFTFGPDIGIVSGAQFTAFGSISANSGGPLATDQSSFRGFATVPEPNVLALLAIGLVGLGLMRRKTAH